MENWEEHGMQEEIGRREEEVTEAQKMRFLFNKAIQLQEEIIADSQRRIEHYRWALDEMDRENNIVDLEPEIQVVNMGSNELPACWVTEEELEIGDKIVNEMQLGVDSFEPVDPKMLKLCKAIVSDTK